MPVTSAVDGGTATEDASEPRMRHVLGISGGKDSAALAIYMRDRVEGMEYIFHDTDKELPETIEYLARLEALLGKKITKTTPDHSFDHWLKVYGSYLPAPNMRWCTKVLKIKPFEKYVGDDHVRMYVGIRADEDRTAYVSTKPNITPPANAAPVDIAINASSIPVVPRDSLLAS